MSNITKHTAAWRYVIYRVVPRPLLGVESRVYHGYIDMPPDKLFDGMLDAGLDPDEWRAVPIHRATVQELVSASLATTVGQSGDYHPVSNRGHRREAFDAAFVLPLVANGIPDGPD
ncbi:MAG: hypothetical protein ACRC7O_02235 [Fimbriiglobus sp.]